MGDKDYIDIRAKGLGRDATVSLRQNELIRNLRALVAVRFEEAIPRIVLVFAGQVLSDVGTIDSKGIVSGVTVHVVLRTGEPGRPFPTPSSVPNTTPLAGDRPMRMLNSASIAYLLDEPNVLRSLLQADPRIRNLLEENAAMRHYLNSDQNLREMLSMAFSPAKQELGRRRDLYLSRMEFVPGGYKLLGRLNYCMLQAYEDNVAMSFQQVSRGGSRCSNPQQGVENREPLPNPWSRPHIACTPDCSNYSTVDLERMGVLARQVLAVRIPVTRSSSHGCQQSRQKQPTSTATQIRRGSLRSRKEARPEQWCQDQLEQLVQRGYRNQARNKRALLISLGNVDSAVRLLDHWNRSVEEE
ncbi:ubiquilin-4 [Drosophila ficusphila]|uniref:ubiquilin-4 n=1 Tax=Drosophila ficusphila TaxID=30025 RepID=UPI0007E74B80|nr:ubiquilin-4 [Drosophila ficusphila]